MSSKAAVGKSESTTALSPSTSRSSSRRIGPPPAPMRSSRTIGEARALRGRQSGASGTLARMHADERRRRRLYPLLVGFLSLVVVALPAVGGGGAGGKAAGPAARLGPRPAAAKTIVDPLTYSPTREK